MVRKRKSQGRPLLFNNPAELEQASEEYFKNETKPTLAGLAHALGCDRKTLWNYEQRDDFFPIIKKIRSRIEKLYEELLVYTSKPTGVIFALKNMGWKDMQEVKGQFEVKPILGGKTRNA